MNGYEFAVNILKRTSLDVGPLIDLAGGYETEWLEFKAATQPESGVMDPGETIGDYRWHIGAALVAMASSTGGAVILGISETKDRTVPTKPIGLEASGFTGDKSKFLEVLKDQIIRPKQWATQKTGNWACQRYPEVETHFGTYRSQNVLVMLVHPIAEDEDDPFVLENQIKGVSRELLLYRSRGDLGRNEQIWSVKELYKWWRARQIDRPELDQRFELFDSEWKKSRLTNIPLLVDDQSNELIALDEALKQYAAKFRAEWDKEIKGQDQVSSFGNDFKKPQSVYESCLNAWHADLDGEVDYQESSIASIQSNKTDVVSLDLPQALLGQSRLFIFGEPGSGKTTRIRHAIYNQIRYGGKRIPFYVSLTGYLSNQLLLQRIQDATGVAADQIELAFDENKVSLVLDGVNETGSGREQLEDEIVRLLARYPHLYVAVTSRNLEDAKVIGEPFVCQLPPFSRSEQREFLSFAFGWSYDRVDTTLDLIHRQPGGEQLAASPLNLCLIANVNSLDIETAGRTRLYQLAFETWLERERQQIEETGEAWFLELEHIRAMLANIAYTMRIQELKDINLSQFNSEDKQVLDEKQIQAIGRLSQLPMFFKYEKKTGMFSFAHETYQEYFTAIYLLDNAVGITGIGSLPGKRWSVVLSMLFDLNPLLNSDFVSALWEVDPLYALYSPADSELFRKDSELVDPWRRLIANVMLNRNEDTLTYDITSLPPKPDDTAKSILSDEQLWYSSARHQASNERIKRLVGLGLRQYDPFSILLKYISRASPELRRKLEGESFGWTSFSLGEFPRFMQIREQVQYLASAVIENPEFHQRAAMLSLSNEFKAFFVDPSALSIHLWRRLVSKFGRMKALKSTFRSAALMYEYSFLQQYPQLASTETEYVIQEWKLIPSVIQQTLLPGLPSVSVLKMLRDGLIERSDISDEVKDKLNKSSSDLATSISAVDRGKIIDGAMTRQMLDHQLLALNAYTPSAVIRTLLNYAGYTGFVATLIEEGVISVDHLFLLQNEVPHVVLENLNPAEIDTINQRVSSRPWVFNVSSEVKLDGNGSPYFIAKSHAFLKSSRPMPVLFFCRENVSVPGIGEPIVGWVEVVVRESKIKVHTTRRWTVVKKSIENLQSCLSPIEVERSIRLLGRGNIDKYGIRVQDFSESFLEKVCQVADNELIINLLNKGAINAKLGCDLIQAGRILKDEIDLNQLSHWFVQADARTLLVLRELGLSNVTPAINVEIQHLLSPKDRMNVLEAASASDAVTAVQMGVVILEEYTPEQKKVFSAEAQANESLDDLIKQNLTPCISETCELVTKDIGISQFKKNTPLEMLLVTICLMAPLLGAISRLQNTSMSLGRFLISNAGI